MRRFKAFTLIELLVVISIIALLISILLPALGAARAQAKAMACMSNQRQIVTAMANYQAEHDGRYASAAWTEFGASHQGAGISHPAGEVPEVLHGLTAYTDSWFAGPSYHTVLSQLHPYLGNSIEVTIDPAHQATMTRLAQSTEPIPDTGVSGGTLSPRDIAPEGHFSHYYGNYGFDRSGPLNLTDIFKPASERFRRSTVLSNPDQIIIGSGASRDDLILKSYWRRGNANNHWYIPGVPRTWSMPAGEYIWPGEPADAVNGRHPGKSVNAMFGDLHVEAKQGPQVRSLYPSAEYNSLFP